VPPARRHECQVAAQVPGALPVLGVALAAPKNPTIRGVCQANAWPLREATFSEVRIYMNTTKLFSSRVRAGDIRLQQAVDAAAERTTAWGVSSNKPRALSKVSLLLI
jgi:hypothetical protein